MSFNSTTRPDDWCYLRSGLRANVYMDADLVGGNVVIPWGRGNGLIQDTFSSGTAIIDSARQNEAGIPYDWHTWPSGSGSWAISSGAASWSGSGTGVAYLEITPPWHNSGNRTVEVTYSATSGTPFIIVHEKGYTTARCITCTVGDKLRVGSFVGTTTLTSGTHTVKAVVSNTVSTTSFDVAIYLDGVLEGSTTLAQAGDTTTMRVFGFGALTGGTGITFDTFKVLEYASLAATSYTVKNALGDTVATGSMPAEGTSITIANSSLQQYSGSGVYGWYHIATKGTARGGTSTGDRAYHDEYGDMYFTRMPDRAWMPTRPSTTAVSTSDDSNNDPTHGWLELGPTRLNLDYSYSGGFVLSTAAAAQTYYVANASTNRPRYIIGAFPAGTAGHYTEVTAIVTAAKSLVKVWETLNEPDLTTLAAAQSFVTTHMQPFYNAVKAGDASAIVIGPANVNPSTTAAQNFINAGGLAYIDQFSFHAYNGNQMDIGRARRMYSNLKATLATNGYTGNIWQTEQGGQAEWNGIFAPLDAARDTALQVFNQEINGLPMERNNYWYDESHGFDDYPGWSLAHYDAAALPGAVVMRNMAAEIWGTTLVGKLDFGDDADMYLAGVWSKTDGSSVLGLMGESSLAPSVSFNISGATGTLVTVDSWGNSSTVAISAGRFTLPSTSMLPTWVRIPVGASVSLTAASRGTDRALTTSGATTSGGGSGSFVNVARITDGTHHSLGNLTYTDPAYNSSGFPQYWKVDLGSSRGIGRISTRVVGPTALTFETSPDNATWTVRYTYSHTKQMDRYAGNHRCFWQRYRSPESIHVWEGDITARYLRVSVTDSMYAEQYIPAFDLKAQADEAYNVDTSLFPMSFHVQMAWLRVQDPTGTTRYLYKYP